MKRHAILWMIIVGLMTACAPAATPSPETPTAPANEYLSIDYTDATNLRSQLALGILRMDGTPNAVTPEQAHIMMPLWQDLRDIQTDNPALLQQIEAALTVDQLTAIAGMKITQTDVQAWANENGIAMEIRQTGSGKGLSPEAKSTRHAQQTATAGEVNTTLVDSMIKYLQSISQ